jgi:hypothetical protein
MISPVIIGQSHVRKGWDDVGPDHPFLSVHIQGPCLAVALPPQPLTACLFGCIYLLKWPGLCCLYAALWLLLWPGLGGASMA